MLAAGWAAAQAADAGARLTIVDGAATLHPAGRPVAAAEGLALAAGVLIDTEALTPRHARLKLQVLLRNDSEQPARRMLRLSL
ncbi:MAG: hypothetical protein HY021_12045, partial [Burkholderiales bacterium]|nr:hypothetical protein [Burkholderiales bacterium]